MNNIRMVVADLDGTLLKSDKHISEYTSDIISKLHEKGILFVVATARPVRAVKNFLPWVKYDAGVFHNGAVIWNESGRIGGTGVENSVQIVSKVLADRPEWHVSIEANDMLYANFDAGQIWPGVQYVKTENFHELQNVVADKVILEAHSIDEMEEFKKYISDDLYLQLSENQIAMIMNKQATKTNGIRLLAEQYEICLEQIIAFGDDYNDIDMLQSCGKGIVVSNALSEVKSIADEICSSNDEDGVAKWLDENILRELL